MTTVQDIYYFLDTYCPFRLAEDWDNPGLNLGRRSAQVKRVLLAMDITSDVLDAAEASDCQLIITHHPLFFDPVRAINSDSAKGALILRLAESRIAHIACHTNLDAAEGGVNTCLAACCGICEAEVFSGIGRMGCVDTTLTALAERLKSALPAAQCTGVRCHEHIKKISVIGGSGGGAIEEAARQGCDTLVTGEAKHSHYLLAKELGINLLVLGHYETEHIALPPLAKALKKNFSALCFTVFEQKSPMENF